MSKSSHDGACSLVKETDIDQITTPAIVSIK